MDYNDWTLLVRIAVPLATLLLGAWLNRYLAGRPKLVYFLVHASGVNITGPSREGDSPRQQLGGLNFHSVVVKNAGRKSAFNVRLGHLVLPDNFSVSPKRPFKVENSEIVFDVLVPGEQITVSYLYDLSMLYSNVNSYVKSDEGSAKVVNALPTPQPPQWLAKTAFLMIVSGVVLWIYILFRLLGWLWAYELK